MCLVHLVELLPSIWQQYLHMRFGHPLRDLGSLESDLKEVHWYKLCQGFSHGMTFDLCLVMALCGVSFLLFVVELVVVRSTKPGSLSSSSVEGNEAVLGVHEL